MTQQTQSSPPSETKRVRICLSAKTRSEWSAVVEVPDDASQQELADLAHAFNRDVDGGDYVDDQDYWENNSPSAEMDVHPREVTDYRITRDEAGKIDCDMLTDLVAKADPPQKMFRVRVHHLQDVAYLVSAPSADEARHFVEASDNADRDFDRETRSADWHVEHVEEIHH